MQTKHHHTFGATWTECEHVQPSPEQAPSDNLAYVQEVQKGIGIFAETGSEHDHFKARAHICHKLIHERSLEDIHLHNLVLDFDWNDEVGIGNRFE